MSYLCLHIHVHATDLFAQHERVGHGEPRFLLLQFAFELLQFLVLALRLEQRVFARINVALERKRPTDDWRPGWTLVVSVAVAVVFLITGVVFFRRTEQIFADVV